MAELFTNEAEFIPAGGIQLEALRRYLECPGVIAVAAGWLASPEAIRDRAWVQVAEAARAALDAAAGAFFATPRP